MKNAILFSKVDREDFWICGGLVFKVSNTKTYIDAYNEIKHLLETKEIVEQVIEDNCLLCDLFKDDESFVFRGTEWSNCRLCFNFMNSQGEDAVFKMSADFVTVCN